VVRKVKSRVDGFNYAVKVISRNKHTKADIVAVRNEIEILSELSHDQIIKVYSISKNSQNYYIVMELILGGDLFDGIVKKTVYKEQDARDICKVLLEALEYCHSKGIAHRSIKPDNLLLASSHDDLNIKVADFGFAKKVTTEKCLLTQCGSPGYIAPEILHGVLYGTKADIWSLGVITYILLGGYPPFSDDDQRELFKKIKRGQYECQSRFWTQVSKQGKQLIRSLLNTNPDKRLTAKEALAHPWITASDEVLGKKLDANHASFRRYNAKRKFTQAISSKTHPGNSAMTNRKK